MATFCHKCGTQAKEDESVFCQKCGTQYLKNIPEKKDDVCPNCGTKILDKQSVFCGLCGSPISPSQPQTRKSEVRILPSPKTTQNIGTPKNPQPVTVDFMNLRHSKYTAIGNTDPICPHCNYRFDKMPMKKRECPNCKKIFYSRTRPLDNKKILLKEDQLAELEEQLAELDAEFELRHTLSSIKRDINTPRQKAEYNKAKSEMTAKFGRGASEIDIFWRFLNNEILYYTIRKDWGLYSNVIRQQAKLLEGEGRIKQALVFYLWICYLDLNGPNNIGGLVGIPGIKGFDPKMGFLAPGIIGGIAKINESLKLSNDEIRTIFFDHNQKIYDAMKLPISPNKAWIDIEKAIWQEK